MRFMRSKPTLPPFKTKSLIIIGVVWSSLLLLSRWLNGSGGAPKTVESALLLALSSIGLSAIFWGSLSFASIRKLIFEPSKPEVIGNLSLLCAGGIAALMAVYSSQQAWELLQQVPR